MWSEQVETNYIYVAQHVQVNLSLGHYLKASCQSWASIISVEPKCGSIIAVQLEQLGSSILAGMQRPRAQGPGPATPMERGWNADFRIYAILATDKVPLQSF
jgi:hypothetical protein